MGNSVKGARRKRLAIITGGTRGIGQAAASRLVGEGMDVLVVSRTAETKPVKGAQSRKVDFSNLKALTAFAEEVRKLSPDILINNVGIERNGPIEKLSLQAFQEVMQVNLVTTFLLSQAALEGMRKRKWGRIVNVTSVWARVGKAHRAAYTASKFAIEGLSVSLADEVVRDGVLVNCVAPGFINIDATGKPGRGPERNAHLASHTPMRRMGKPEEVASAIVWLAGDECGYMSGQTMVVDGGFASSGSRSATF